MNQNLLIIGSRHLGALAQEIARKMEYFEEINYIPIQEEEFTIPYQHTSPLLLQLSVLSAKYSYAIAAVNHTELRLWLLRELENCCYTIPTLTHPFTAVSPYASIGKGCMIEAGAVIEGESRIGDGVVVCAGSIICAYSLIGEGSYVGLRSVIKEGTLLIPGTKTEAGTILSGIAGEIPVSEKSDQEFAAKEREGISEVKGA